MTKGRKMIGKLKALGLMLMMALALSLTGMAPTASAEFFYFASEAEHTTLKGEQLETSSFEVDGGTTSCKSATFTGTVPDDAVVEVAAAPVYTECTSFGFATTKVNMNSCGYVLLPRTKEGSNYEAELDIRCETENDSITFTVELSGVVKCTIHVGEQQGLSTVTVSEEGSPSKIRASLNLTGIKYDQTAGSGLAACPTANNTTNGTYKGTVVFSGFQGETQVGISQVAQKPKIEFIPKEIDFEGKGAKTIRKFQMKNLSNEDLELVKLSLNDFKPLGKCQSKVLAKNGGQCPQEEEVECLKPKRNGFVTFEFKPFYLGAIRAKKC